MTDTGGSALHERLIEKRLNHRSDKRAGNGGLCSGQRTVRCDRTIVFDGEVYFDLNLTYYQRQRVWVEYAQGNYKSIVNVYEREGGRKICTIDNTTRNS